jgi:hypothetical protein
MHGARLILVLPKHPSLESPLLDNQALEITRDDLTDAERIQLEDFLKATFRWPDDYLTVVANPSYLRTMMNRGGLGYPPEREDRIDLSKPETFRPWIEADLFRRRFLNQPFGFRPDHHDMAARSASNEHRREQDPKKKSEKRTLDDIESRYWAFSPFNANLTETQMKTIRKDVMNIAQMAIDNTIVFHEPHHDLTPGMLLTDELFRRIVADVGVILFNLNKNIAERQIDPSVPELGFRPLRDYVNGLNSVDDSSCASPEYEHGRELGNYIADLKTGPSEADYVVSTNPGPEGSVTSLNSEKVFRHDPTRVDLFVIDPWIVAATVIVGAWKGGTHSDGSTVHA